MIAGFEITMETKYTGDEGTEDDVSMLCQQLEWLLMTAAEDYGFEVEFVDARNTFVEYEQEGEDGQTDL
jgi:hypothetical protein